MSAPSATVSVLDAPLQIKRITVVLVNSEAAARSQLRHVLENERDMSVIVETNGLAHVRRHVREHHPDVVVVALSARDRPTLGVLRTMLSAGGDTRYVVMSIEQDAEQEALPDAIRLASSSNRATSYAC